MVDGSDRDAVPCACRFRDGVWHRCPTHAAIAERRNLENDPADFKVDANDRPRYPWGVRCDTCGWVDSFATKEGATRRAAAHNTKGFEPHLVRVVDRER